jgi:RNA polymerase sigma factor (sigma-70 family)
MLDEPGLIEQAVAGDKDAFAELVRQNQDRIFGFIMRMTADRETALDLTQETFLAAYQNLAGFRQESSFSTWLFQIAANKTKNFIKKAHRETALPDDFDQADNSSRPDRGFERRQQERLLHEAMESLPHKQQVTFSLRYYDQLKFEAIARILGVSVSAAKTNFAEAVKKLKKRLA